MPQAAASSFISARSAAVDLLLGARKADEEEVEEERDDAAESALRGLRERGDDGSINCGHIERKVLIEEGATQSSRADKRKRGVVAHFACNAARLQI